MSQNNANLEKDCTFKRVYLKPLDWNVQIARDAIKSHKGLLVLVRDAKTADNLTAGTLVCYPHNEHLYGLELLDGATINFEFPNLLEMYA